jgi:putative FmdB family regulatory protein
VPLGYGRKEQKEMPTYEYKCTSCLVEIEIEHSIKDEPLKKCRDCGRDSLQRLISCGTNFSLKGGGWYKDLYSKPQGEDPK